MLIEVKTSRPPIENGAASAHARLEPARYGNEQFVADQMAEAVVDHFEAIEIEKQDREAPGVALLEMLQSSPDRLQEHGAVREAGQRIAPHRIPASLLRRRLF